MPAAKRKLTPRQEEIRDLVKAQPRLSVKDLAALLETSEQAIYQQLSRLRSLGALPKARAASKRKRVKAQAANRSAPVARTPRAPHGATQVAPAKPPAQPEPHARNNGGHSVEDAVAEELEGVRKRIHEIGEQRSSLTEEEHRLSEREARLDAAQKALA